MKIAICDDELMHLNATKIQLEEAYKSLDLMIYPFQDGRKLIDSIEKTTYDLIILDIETNAVPGLSPGLSHQTCLAVYAPFTPSKSG